MKINKNLTYISITLFFVLLFAPVIIDRVEYFSSTRNAQHDDEPLDDHSLLKRIQERKILHVGMLKSNIPYYALTLNHNKEPNNVDYELIRLFAQKIGAELVLHEKQTLTDLFNALEKDEIDIIASGLSLLPAKFNNYFISPAYQIASQHLIYRRGTYRPRSMQNVKENILVADHSVQVPLLRKLKQTYPNLNWKIKKEVLPEDLVKMVAKGEIKYTIIESTTLSRLQLTYPELAIAFTIQKAQPIGWQMKKNKDHSLSDAINLFMHSIIDNGVAESIVSKYYNHISQFDYVNIASFINTIENTLNFYRDYFETYSKENNLDWQILAAISYQESHWNPKAVSPTGVRGIMMLTQTTAKLMKVKDRLNPEDSIRGGAAYIKKLLNLVPQQVPKEDRIWFALTAYNMGIAHLYDLIKLVKSEHDNPYAWDRVKNYLPLMDEQRYYKTLKYGKANGIQAYQFVENIKLYKMVLSSYLAQHPNARQENPVKEESGIKAEKDSNAPAKK